MGSKRFNYAETWKANWIIDLSWNDHIHRWEKQKERSVVSIANNDCDNEENAEVAFFVWKVKKICHSQIGRYNQSFK